MRDILEKRLRDADAKIEVLDGDVVRTNLSKGLGFSKEDRDTNIKRIGFVCAMLSRNGVIAIAAAISPYRDIRDGVRAQIENFVEVYAECPLESADRARRERIVQESPVRGNSAVHRSVRSLRTALESRGRDRLEQRETRRKRRKGLG